MMYRICEYCGSALDPDERCDCKENAAPELEPPKAATQNLDTFILGEKEGNVKMLDTENGNHLSPLTGPTADNSGEIMVIRQLPIIAENLRSVQPYIQNRLHEVLTMPCTEETVKQIKEIRAQLNKEFRSLDARRIEIKNAVMAPYMALESDYKECISNQYKQADDVLRDRIAQVEMAVLSQKTAEVAAYFEEYLQTMPSIPTGLVCFDKACIKVNMSVSMKKLKEQAKAFLDSVNAECELISMGEDAAEVMAEYKCTLNYATAAMAVKRRKEAAKVFAPKVIAPAAMPTVEAASTADPMSISVNDEPLKAPMPQISAEAEHTVSFTVTGTMEQLKALTQFLRNGAYIWKQIKA